MIGLLRIEARHNPVPLVLPLLAVLLWITPLAQDLAPVGLWLDRSVDVEGSIQLTGPFAAAAAAWSASREHRRDMTGLRTSTPRNPWAAVVATWLVSLAWMVAFYLGLCAIFLSVTAAQATWGFPQWWPVIDALVALVMCSAAGFALGLWFRTWFVTPLVAAGTLAVILGVRAAAPSERAAGIGLLSPMYPAFGLNASVFYAPQPDLSILKIICYLGVLGLALGAMAWYFRADRPSLRRTGAALLAAGLALTATAAVLDATARIDSHGVIVPAFHNAAADRAVPYIPVCSRTPLPVCVHPAYAGGNELTVLATIINQIAAPVLGVPGMPARAEQVPDAKTSLGGVQGNPPVLPIQPFIVHGTHLQPAAFQVTFADSVALSLFIPARSPVERATPAQRALALYLITQARDATDSHLLPPDPAVTAAAARFAALSPASRTVWLTAHLAALRAGYLTPEDIP
jgi:hypothetical protein